MDINLTTLINSPITIGSIFYYIKYVQYMLQYYGTNEHEFYEALKNGLIEDEFQIEHENKHKHKNEK